MVKYWLTMNVKTRMAPSPTGEYHVGHIRTVLYNWAFARQNNGEFIIRIEDTDRERFVEGATERILEVIKDYGFDWDEGPIYQSKRLDIYKKYSEELVEKGHAYYCFCSAERLKKLREEQRAQKMPVTKYDRHCLNLSKEEVEKRLKSEPHVIRLKVPDNKKIVYEDVVYGKVEVNSSDLDDQILIKSDGFPTYHFAVVVDDHLMEITYVMRGNDWLPSTPKHVILYEAFGWKLPVYVHLPNLKELGKTTKLSKRMGPVSAREFLDEGYLPEAVDNFLMLLGWNPGTEQEIFSLDEFIKRFDINKIHKTDLVAFDRKKLNWMNSEYIKNTTDEELSNLINNFFENKYDLEKVKQITPLVKTRISTLKEFDNLTKFFFESPTVDQKLFGENYKDHLIKTIEVLEKIENWELGVINDELMKVVKSNDFHTGKFFMNLRVAVTGQKVTPPFNESIAILGKEETLKRMKSCL